MGSGPAFFVDGKQGDDANSGSFEQPWRTINHAVTKLQPGDTLYLREGVFHERVMCRQSGKSGKPITIRSYPKELAIIDGGLPQFSLSPQDAWEPVNGEIGEYHSSRIIPRRAFATADDGDSMHFVSGNFADSMIPLHGYRLPGALQATHESRIREGDAVKPFYVGPGLWYNPRSQRIHVRLAHTHIKAFGQGNYTGETDPRKVPLVIAPWNATPLTLLKSKHVNVEDVVLRGGGDSCLLIRGCEQVRLNGLTIYAGYRGVRVETTGHLQVEHCNVRGPMPPWGSRSASKYAAVDSHLFVPVGTKEISREKRKYFLPICHDFEIAHCEFTDGHDGAYVGGVKRLKFHHNLVDNMNDDGVYLSAWGPPGSDVHIYQNRLSRCLTMFAFGLGRGSESEPGQGVFIYRNLIDQRAPVPYAHPDPAAPSLTSYGRLCGDHGGPVWEPMAFYHNTVITQTAAYRNFYAAGLGGHTRGSRRHVFNNIFVQIERAPGLVFDADNGHLECDGNLHWKPGANTETQQSFFKQFRQSPTFAASKRKYAPGWTAQDLFADPLLKQPPQEGSESFGCDVQSESPTIDAGVALPQHFPDPCRKIDQGKPDIGAVPHGSQHATLGPQKM